MKKKLLTTLPVVFSLRNHGGYDKLVALTGARRMMQASWDRGGQDLERAIAKVGQDVEKKNTHG